MKHQYLLSLFVLFLSVDDAISQNSHWDYYLNSEEVNEIIIDGSYVWAATNGGLVQIDRQSLQSMVCHRGNSILPSHHVTHLLKDEERGLFAHTGNGSAWVIGTEMFPAIDQLSGIPANGLLGDLWVAGDSGIWKIEDRWERKRIADLPATAGWYILTDFVVDPFNEDLWLTGWTFGSFRIYHFDGDEWEVFDYQNSDLPFESAGNNKLTFDQRGDLWTATQAGLFVFKGSKWEQVFISPDVGTSFSCTAIHIDKDKRLWVAGNTGWNAAARLFVKDADQWVEYPLQDSIRLINDIQVDKNEIWLATHDQGIHLHREGEAWRRLFLSNSQMVSNWVTALDWDPKEKLIWVGVQGKGQKAGKLYYMKNGELTPEAIPPTNYIRQVVRDPDGALWMVGNDAVFVKQDRFWTTFNPSPGRIQPEYIEAVSFDHEGTLWMIHNDELAIHQWNNQYKYLSMSDVKQTAAMYNLFHHPDRNEAWVSSYREFSHFNGGRWNSSEEMLGEQVIMYDALADSQGVVWLATDKGLLRYDSLKYDWFKPEESETVKFKTITQKSDGSLWLSTGNYMWRFTETDGFLPKRRWGEEGPGGLGTHNSPVADRAELLQADGQGNLWIASHGLGVWGSEPLPWAAPHEIAIGGELAQGESLIYPNPVVYYGKLHIFVKGENFDRIRLFDRQGKEMINEWLDTPTSYYLFSLREGLDAQHFTAGHYYLSLYRGDEMLLTKKIVITDR